MENMFRFITDLKTRRFALAKSYADDLIEEVTVSAVDAKYLVEAMTGRHTKQTLVKTIYPTLDPGTNGRCKLSKCVSNGLICLEISDTNLLIYTRKTPAKWAHICNEHWHFDKLAFVLFCPSKISFFISTYEGRQIHTDYDTVRGYAAEIAALTKVPLKHIHENKKCSYDVSDFYFIKALNEPQMYWKNITERRLRPLQTLARAIYNNEKLLNNQ